MSGPTNGRASKRHAYLSPLLKKLPPYPTSDKICSVNKPEKCSFGDKNEKEIDSTDAWSDSDISLLVQRSCHKFEPCLLNGAVEVCIAIYFRAWNGL